MKHLIIIFTTSLICFAVDQNVDLIPNGGRYSCGMCHEKGVIDELTRFGRDAQRALNKEGSLWENLYGRDSDGDGFTNGQELQDPEGNWKYGMHNPDVKDKTTNPADEQDYPEVTSITKELAFTNKPNELVLEKELGLNSVFFVDVLGKSKELGFNKIGNLIQFKEIDRIKSSVYKNNTLYISRCFKVKFFIFLFYMQFIFGEQNEINFTYFNFYD